MFRELRPGDAQVLRNALEDTRLTVLIGRGHRFTDMLENVGDRPDRATFVMSDNSVVGEDQEFEWFGDGALVVLFDYDGPNRSVIRRYTINEHPAKIVDSILAFEEAQGHEAAV
jgi:uncharacterized protein YhfF